MKRTFSLLLRLSLLICTGLPLAAQTNGEATNPSSTETPPTYANIAYGSEPQQTLNFWQAKSDKATPFIMDIHGGGWFKGPEDPLGYDQWYLDHGISVAHITYRFTPDHPLPTPVMDAVRALQFLKTKSADWNIDPNHVIVTGTSAGGCSALWIATHDDLADPKSADPVERMSTRVNAAAVNIAQTTIEPQNVRDWVGPQALAHDMIHFAGGFSTYDQMMSSITNPDVAKLYANFSPINQLSPNAPPMLLHYGKAAPPGQGGIHDAAFGVKFKEKADAVGAKNCYLSIDGDPEHTGYPGGVRAFVLMVFNIGGLSK